MHGLSYPLFLSSVAVAFSSGGPVSSRSSTSRSPDTITILGAAGALAT